MCIGAKRTGITPESELNCNLIKPLRKVEQLKLNNLQYHPLGVVSRYREPQLQVGENYSYLLNCVDQTSANLDVGKHILSPITAI